MKGYNLPDNVSPSDPEAPWNKEEHFEVEDLVDKFFKMTKNLSQEELAALIERLEGSIQEETS